MTSENYSETGKIPANLEKHYIYMIDAIGSETAEKAREKIPELDKILEEEIKDGGRLHINPSSPVERFTNENNAGYRHKENWAEQYENVAFRVLNRYKHLEIGEFEDDKIGYAKMVESVRDVYYRELKEWYKHYNNNRSRKIEDSEEELREIGLETYLSPEPREDLDFFREATYEFLRNGDPLLSPVLEFLKASEIKIVEENEKIPNSQRDEVEIRYKVVGYFKRLVEKNTIVENSSY